MELGVAGAGGREALALGSDFPLVCSYLEVVGGVEECELWELSLYCLWADACVLGRVLWFS